ncbi:interleukin-22 receptor subunit alpha-2-like isoform X1 [Gadus chalcogrammus]|uniref:interleukin-22 receptor subunit alpha-2-like isoform X1 n=1 Tax=Gadus chalcogrammus TaxID=1042646 RepID=UPI0024C4C175|nr:interleukin-22 receptor subunit alpha-2-like isoform X1 [Gadus chalcogrammus]
MALCGFLSPGSRVYTAVSLMLGVLVSGNPPSRLTAQGSLASPMDPRFDSVDYKNVFRWSAPDNATLTYSVQWKIYGDSQWVQVKGCQGIQSLQCDLSRVTSDSREWYYARVHASSTLLASRSAWALSRRFSPSWDTKISPPTLNLTMTAQGLVVRLIPPPALVRKLHKKLCCRVHLRHSSGEEDRIEMKSCKKELVLDYLRAGTEYCLQAQCVVCLRGKSSAPTPSLCITTLQHAAASLFTPSDPDP